MSLPLRKIVVIASASLLFAACGNGDDASDTQNAAGAPASAGVQEESPKDVDSRELLRQSSEVIKATKSWHMVGEVKSATQKVSFDMQVSNTGDADGTMALGGPKLQLRKIKGKTYLRGKSFWAAQGGAAAAKLIGDKWVLAPAAQASTFEAGFKAFTMDDVAQKFTHDVASTTSEPELGATPTIQGRPTQEIIAADGSYYIATDGTADLLRVRIPTTASGSGQLDFSEFNKALDLTVPPKPLKL